jgi:hypothetical protein
MSKSVSGFAAQSRLRRLRKLICAIPLSLKESIMFHDFGLVQVGQAQLELIQNHRDPAVFSGDCVSMKARVFIARPELGRFAGCPVSMRNRQAASLVMIGAVSIHEPQSSSYFGPEQSQGGRM